MPSKKAQPAPKLSYLALAKEAITAIGSRTGSGQTAIENYIFANHSSMDYRRGMLRRALKTAVEKGDLVHPPHHAASYRLPPKSASKKAAKKPAAKKPAAKKPAAKKATVKKTTSKKSTAKTTAKKSTTKKTTAKKSTTKKTTSKKSTTKKTTSKRGKK